MALNSISIIPRHLLSDNKLSVEEWNIPCSVHPAPKRGWHVTNALDKAEIKELNARDLIDSEVVSHNLGTETTKSGKVYELGKNEVPLFCPVHWNDTTGNRAKSKVESVTAMVFDFDECTEELKQTTLDAFEKSEVMYIAYSSFSDKAPHKKGLSAFRVIVPFDEPVSIDDYNTDRRGVWFFFEQLFPHLDQATKDPSRLWFMPSCRSDRRESRWTDYRDGFAISAQAVINAAFGEDPRPTTTVTVPAAPLALVVDNGNGGDNGGGDNNDGGGEEPQPVPEQPAQPERYQTYITRIEHPIVCHDSEVRPFSWVIENWNALPKNNSGNYQCFRMRPNGRPSTTLGSAFVSRTIHPLHLVARYRLTCQPARTHHDCDTTDHDVTLSFSNRNRLGFSPKLTVPNVVRLLELMEIDLFRDARTGYDYLDGEMFSDQHYTVVQDQFFKRWRLDCQRQTLITAVDTYCELNQVDTLAAYLNELVWDGVPRLAGLFTKYFKAEDTELNRVYGIRWAISAVARALKWGCKVDTMLILKGEQGIRKSTFFKVLAGDCALTGNSYFSDERFETTGTDGLAMLRYAWIHEWAELSGMSRKEAGEVKSFITKSEDKYRKKYARKEIVAPRHCILTGSVNDAEIFTDSTGSRRFWVVECLTERNEESYDVSELAANRDQIWAEAVHLYRAGEQWHLTKAEEQLSMVSNSKFDSVDVHYTMVEEWLADNPSRIFNLADMIEDIYTETYDVNGEERKRPKAIKPKTYMQWYSKTLKELGCGMLNDGKRCRHNGKNSKWYVAPADDSVDVATDDTNNGKQREVKFNKDGTVMAVREFGQQWVFFEDMDPDVQKDWAERYPKKTEQEALKFRFRL